ncbi:Uncharacterized protein APZ42_002712, partial [Daphnia magna]
LLSEDPRLRPGQPLQLPPRRPAHQRRDHAGPGQQEQHRSAQRQQWHPSRHQLTRRPGEPGGQAPDRASTDH